MIKDLKEQFEIRNDSSVKAIAGGDFSGEFLTVDLLLNLRDLPGRRSVWKTEVGGGEFLVKIYFLHSKQVRDVDAEWGNANRLEAEKLSMPKPLFKTEGKSGEIVIGFEWISEGETLDQLMSAGDVPQGVFDNLFLLHAAQHQAGCYQSDNHLGNYLYSKEKLFLLDFGSYVFEGKPLQYEARVKNLAVLLANIPLGLRRQARESIARYVEGCGADIEGEVLVRELEDELPKSMQIRLRKYYKKTRRSCTEFEREDSGGKTWLACRKLPEALKKALQTDPDQFFDSEDLLKDGNTCTVTKVDFDNRVYVLKRYNKKPLSYRLSHLLITPRALRSWTNGHVLNLFGVKTPRPQACLLVRSGGLMDRAYLLMANAEGETLDTVNSERILSAESSIPKAFADRWAELEAIGATHGDMKASNIIVTPEGDLTLIDLDGLKFDKSDKEHKRRREKDMKRFMRNWEGKPELIKAFQEALTS